MGLATALKGATPVMVHTDRGQPGGLKITVTI